MHGSRLKLSCAACVAVIAGTAALGGPMLLAGQPEVAEQKVRDVRAEFEDADALLVALEDADRDLISLTGDVRYDRISALVQDHQVSLGRLFFSARNDSGRRGGDGRRFAIRFHTLILDDVVRPEEKLYIFDGQWLVEKLPEERLFIKRQIVPPGENFDPLRIGEGPMPLPIGQKREDILERYIAELREPTDGLAAPDDADDEELKEAEALQQFARGAHQIRLTPRPEWREEDEFVEVRLWYGRRDGGQLLPRMARTVDKAGNISIVRLVNVQVQMTGQPENPDARVPAEVLDTTVPLAGWHVQIVDWRGRGAGGDAR
jgi:hypothetical protein